MPQAQDKGETKSLWIWPFELKEQIGEGGMGVVYRARYVVNDRELAVKMVPTDVTDKTMLARFEREMAVLKDLKHPHIVRCFGGVCEDKRRFYAMELISGGSLEDVLQKRGRLPWEQVVEYGLQMCAALECSHQHGVIHRDVKPSNFLITNSGRLKLSDFGLASVTAHRRITRAGKTAGTFLYMAPEQIRGKPLSPQTDLYALGCVFFELLTGRPPFLGETPAATLHMHCTQQPPRVSESVLDCPASLDALIQRLLEKEPEQRPESAAAVARELRTITPTVTVVPGRADMGGARVVSNQPLAVSERDLETAAETPIASPRPAAAIRQSVWLPLIVIVALLAAALASLGYWRERSVNQRWEQQIVELMQADIPQVRAAAMRSAGRMGTASPALLEELGRRLEADDPVVRTDSARALAEAGAAAKSWLPALHRLKNDPDPEVREAAREAEVAIRDAPSATPGWLPPAVLILLAAGAAFWYWRTAPGPQTRSRPTGLA